MKMSLLLSGYKKKSEQKFDNSERILSNYYIHLIPAKSRENTNLLYVFTQVAIV